MQPTTPDELLAYAGEVFGQIPPMPAMPPNGKPDANYREQLRNHFLGAVAHASVVSAAHNATIAKRLLNAAGAG